MTQPPPNPRLTNVAFYLYLIAGALALGAAALEYLQARRIASTALFGGVFMIVMAVVTRRKGRGVPPGGV